MNSLVNNIQNLRLLGILIYPPTKLFRRRNPDFSISSKLVVISRLNRQTYPYLSFHWMVGESSVRSQRVSQVSSTSSNSTGGWICCRHLSLFFCCHPLLTLSLQSLLLPATIIILYSKPLKRFHSFVGTCDMRPTWKLSIVSAPYWTGTFWKWLFLFFGKMRLQNACHHNKQSTTK